ncbi:MAG: type VII secretion protein EssC, partial [Ruminococcus sp.]|nr:type VII secretion protein EssC [Ruminococcus sp.]
CTMIIENISDEKNKFAKFCPVSKEVKEYQVRIGTDPQKNDIVLDNPYISSEHAIIYRKMDGEQEKWYVTDPKSTNGTYVNHKKIPKRTEYELSVGDVVFIVGYKFIICSDVIAANINISKSLKNNAFTSFTFKKFEKNKKKKQKETEYFYRTIDLGEKKLEFDEITLLPPERTAIREEQSILLSMGSAFTMSTATLLVAAYSAVAAYYRGTNISYVVPSFIMAGSMVLSSLIWPSVIRRHKAKEAAEKEEIRVRNYQEYIMQLRDSVNVMKDDEKAWLCSQYHTVEECMKRVINRDRYLWSKSINDDDFMNIAIGLGKRNSAVRIKYREDSDTFFKDNLRYDMLQFAKEDQVLENAPITLSLNNGCICGISGDPDCASELIREMIVQLTALYSYDELKLVFIIKEEEKEKWEYVKWLPHVWNSDGTFRYVASSDDDVKELVNELEKEVESRSSRNGEDFPKMLIVALDKKRVDSIDIMPLMMKKRKQLNISFLTSFGMYNYNNSELIIELSKEQAALYDRRENTVTRFQPYQVTDIPSQPGMTFENYLDKIANIKLDISTEKYQLPKMLTFLDMFRVSKVEHLNSLMRWRENNPIKSLKTEIGVAPSGDTFFIDMHEKFHGPHGLIAGTTGSGKSESIITLILSLAVNYSPEEVAFVIVDYKGGGLADAFNDVKEEIIDGKSVEVQYKLPHVVGTVTNLDGATIERACISIDTELKRRQMLFKKARKISNEGTMDIYKYQQLRREGAELEMLPHLFIVCDEFAELKADRSDFMELLVSAARIGRSLGIHLVLATQKPDNVVSPQIWSNSRFKICLKVQGKEDSKAVIHCPDAAEISTTGRFFFQVGYNEVFSMGQSAWCGADYLEAEEFVKKDVESVEVISNTGTVLYEKSRKPEMIVQENAHVVSQLIAVRNYLIEIAKDIEIPPLWRTPLPTKISLRQLYAELVEHPSENYIPLAPVIGKKDDLYNRIQDIMTVSFSEKGNLVIYGAAGSGMDMFFTSMIYSLLYGYTPEQVILYVLDFDSGFLKTFEKAPHVGDVLTSEETMDVRKLLSGIRDEIIRRSKLFSEYQGKYKDYCKYSDGEKLPNILLILNNYTEFLEKFDGDDMAELIYIIREGTSRGVFVIIGTSTVNVNSRLKQYIQQTFMLKMNDPTDYLGVLGRTGGIMPSDCEGSGIVKEENITYKFQIADIFNSFPKEDDENTIVNDTSKEVRELVAELQKKYQNVSVPSYRFHEVSAENLLKENLSWSHLPVGADGEETVFYNFSDKYITFVSSVSEETLTKFAGYLAKALSRDSSINVAVLDPTGTLRPDDDVYRCYSTLPELEKWNQEYKTDIESRCKKLIKNEKGDIVMSEDTQHVYVIINSFTTISVMDTLNVTFTNLKMIINELPEIHYHYIILDTPEKMNAERGAYFHIVKCIDPNNVSDISTLDVEKNRAWFDASGIWLGEGISRAGFFDIGGKSLPLSASEGVFVQNRKAGRKFTCFS